ncbi:hypothetical protein CLV24_105112 [Pontibacter ummariensis]|uniref:Uncharacterized protein n=1 Tax=Pontibacter ummariensis TaxID=1610492 RepID=A0A239DX34_9BACT|nr:hypothetical protein [Pontibacter ummariensis]PRY13742.1 hypothetical protein CLV24_105112 [Pontibacter ummariensis]SNS36262.1 hypothetical protein SAMN06296052_105139 [Pontibacter ummariensis]
MNKKDITKTISSGTAKEKVLLLTEDVARRKSGSEPILSEEDFHALLSSVERPQERRLYNQFRKIDQTVTTGLYVLNQSRVLYRMHISDLRGYALMWEAYQRAEELANFILHETRDKAERTRIAQKAASYSSFLLADLKIDQEGYVEVSAESSQKPDTASLLKAIAGVRREAEKELSRTLGYAQALLDYMEERDFKVKTYQDKVKDVMKDVQTDKALWSKYSTQQKKVPTRQGSKRREMEREHLFSIYPDPSEIQMDMTAYHHFKRNVVGYE